MPIDTDLILPDMHFPYVDRPALECVKEIVKEYRPRRIIILGDALDACAFSAHPRRSFDDKAADYLRDEVEPFNDFLDEIQGRGKREIVYHGGNHEFRVERFCRNMGGPGAAVFRAFSPEHVIRGRVRANGRQRRERERMLYIPYMGKGVHSHYKVAPNLITIHGWYHGTNCARAHRIAANGTSICFGHVHGHMVDTYRNPITGEIIWSWSPGCLRDLVPSYSANQPNRWSHGATLLRHDRNRPERWQPYHVSIRDGEAILPDKSI